MALLSCCRLSSQRRLRRLRVPLRGLGVGGPGAHRITSYNVCYTKLLRGKLWIQPERRLGCFAGAAPDLFVRSEPEYSVVEYQCVAEPEPGGREARIV